LSAASAARIALSADGRRIATWIALKPPHEMPHMPTFPLDQGMRASCAMISTASSSSRSEYSRSGAAPSEDPVPRRSTLALARPLRAQ
jgi:hypothetical protein